MSEKEKKTNDEEKTVPQPEGYTIVKYLEFVVIFCFVIGVLLSIPLYKMFKDDKLLSYGVLLAGGLFFWVIGHKFTEVKVNLRVTDKGLEQTRLSGSRFCPKYRLIEWKNMSRYYLNPRGLTQGMDFLVFVYSGNSFRISMSFIRIFEKQKNNDDNLEDFKEDFLEKASKYGVERDFFDG